MDVSTLPHVQAKHYKPGRTEPIRAIVIHTVEGPCSPGEAMGVARWFGGATAPEASSHYVCGPEVIVACVSEDDTAWHAPPSNAWAIGIEHTAVAADVRRNGVLVYAAFTPADWASPNAQAMLARSAELVADICTRRGIPVVFLDADALQRGEAGITTHVEVSKAFRETDHIDPGPNWPMDAYLALVHGAMPPEIVTQPDTLEPTEP